MRREKAGSLTGGVQGLRKSLGEVRRWAISLAPFLNLVPRPEHRPDGISAIVRVRDEEEWLEPALRSIVGFADQIVVGDNGSRDRTPAIIEALRREYPSLVEALCLPDMDICGLTNALIDRARYRWIIRWDADFVAQTSGPYDIRRLREWLLGLDFRRYYLVYVSMVELSGDLWHQDPATPAREDAHCWTASDCLRYVYDARGYESPRAPGYYAIRRWRVPCLYHVSVKSDERTFLSYVWKRYLVDPGRSRCPSLAAYAAGLCQAEFGHRDLRLASREWIRQYVTRLIPFDVTRYPEHPALLRPYLAHPRYQILYENGRIADRLTQGDDRVAEG